MSSYMPAPGTTQATLKGRQWRHGIIVWAFMVAGLIGRRETGSKEPCDPPAGKRKRTSSGSSPSPLPTGKQRTTGTAARLDAGSDADSDAGSNADPDTGSDADSGATRSDGGEEGEETPVPLPENLSDEYQDVFPSMPTHDAVLDVVCRGALLMGKLCQDNVADGAELSNKAINEISDEAHQFVTRYVRVLFGAIHSTKLHKLAFHLGDELRRRGNLTEADTSINEMLHKLCKVMYIRTNKQVTTFEVQLLRCEQTLARIIAEDVDATTLSEAEVGTAAADSDPGSDIDDEFDAWGVSEDFEGDAGGTELSNLAGGVEGAAVESGSMMVGGIVTATEDTLADAPAHNVASLQGNNAVAAAAPAAAAVRKRVRVRGRRIRLDVVAAAAAGRLRALPALLGLAGDKYVTVRNSATVRAMFEWGALPRDQTVRAAEILHGKPWFDHVVYRAGPDWRMRRHGLVRLVLCAVGGSTCHALVVQRLVTAKERPGCVLTKHGCRRFKWLMNPETGQPALHVVALTDVQRLEHIVPDFEDLCERRGLFGLPGTFPETPVELSLQRFFSNKFFPWTGGLTYSLK